MWVNEAIKKLGIRYPIIQAPMAGGITTTELITSVASSGALAMIGAGYMKPDSVRKQIREIKKQTTRPFGINVFVPRPFSADLKQIQTAKEILKPFTEEDIATEIPTFEKEQETYEAIIEIILKEEVPICSFTFGLPAKAVIERFKEKNTILIGTATTVKEAIEAEKAGLDMVVLQGSEAGGHRGNFLHDAEESSIGLMSFIPQTVNQVTIPVIAAGGIMDARGALAARCLGAAAVQMGTAFLTCKESGAHDLHKKAILTATEDKTVMTKAFSGKWARGIQNEFIAKTKSRQSELPAFPIQNALTKGIRSASSARNSTDFMSLWSGQSPMLAKDQSVEELIQSLIKEAEEVRGLL
ncbi:NAD(P)H-dependent flavin oxidoreductase [Jeotgalibacillus proteolyticus]|uniref:Probable nitronate monooxygenase n=1 Tax=Jeotgalibacillus proteolyticus TaxID=2082395 RepID=A0A2S5G6G7_9BACL|nr:nitronate monooxygenase [Jeotgalibacillus proteolyticus]PPA68572.1 nitronate monooxygenase [Jeotgalibacillus proteolyticus]